MAGATDTELAPRGFKLPTSTEDWIAELVPGKSFADVGGLWGARNEKVTVALAAGARDASMIDIAPLGHKLWTDFDAHAAAKGFTDYARLQFDATSPEFRLSGLSYDVVHCSGVIYHLPSPQVLVENLTTVTREFLILAAMTVPEVIENEEGRLDLAGARGVFVPGLDGDAMRIVRRHFDDLGLKINAINTDEDESWYIGGRPNFGPWWWLITPTLLCSFVEVAGFEVLGVHEPWPQRATAVVCRKS
jgi:hypothetical protein